MQKTWAPKRFYLMSAETMLGQSMQGLDTVVLKKQVHLSREVKTPGGPMKSDSIYKSCVGTHLLNTPGLQKPSKFLYK